MNPIAFKIGPIPVHWYGIIIAVAIGAGLLTAKRLGRHFDFYSGLFEEFLVWALPAALVGARLWYVLFQLDYYLAHPGKIIAVWEGGLAIHGAIFAAIGVALLWTRAKKINFLRFADVAAPALVLGQAIGRWANFVNQEAYGSPTDLPWALFIAGEYRHPTFLYESVWNLLIFIGLYYFLKSKPEPGRVFALYLVGYSFGRFFIEGLRTDSLMLGSLRVGQVISVLMIAAGLVLFFIANKMKRKVQDGEINPEN